MGNSCAYDLLYITYRVISTFRYIVWYFRKQVVVLVRWTVTETSLYLRKQTSFKCNVTLCELNEY